MSPTLSNLFQNDLHDLFDNTCDPVLLAEFEINSLLWADDLVLFSSTKIGLQKCLDNLAAYCHMWQLEVNVDKVMVMSTDRTAARDITFQGQELQCVNFFFFFLFRKISYITSAYLCRSSGLSASPKLPFDLLVNSEREWHKCQKGGVKEHIYMWEYIKNKDI